VILAWNRLSERAYGEIGQNLLQFTVNALVRARSSNPVTGVNSTVLAFLHVGVIR